MINLIRNELTKISKKKSIYITLLITLGFVILTNIIYQLDMNYMEDPTDSINFYEQQLKELDPNNVDEAETYISYQSELQTLKLIQKYGGNNSWQAKILQEQGRNLIYDMNYAKYLEKDEKAYEEAKQKQAELIAKLDAGDWKYFAKEELKQVEENLKQQEEAKQKTTSAIEIAEIEEQIYQFEIQKQILNWRLDKNICYGEDYYNQCLNQYRYSKHNIREYETTDKKDLSEKEKYQNKLEYYDAIETAAISQYDIEHQTVTGDKTSAKGILQNAFVEYELFIIIMAVMIAGTIVSEEFNKGTIKLLLIKPYKRVTILTAKLIAAVIVLLIVILLVILMQFVVGGIIQGFDTYGEPSVVYNHTTNQIEEINMVSYLGMQAIGKLPIYILLLTLAFSLSTIFTNSALAIAITLLGSMSSSMINLLAQEFNLVWIKFFVTPNWDLTQYFFGNLPQFQGLTMQFSILIILLYMVIMLVPSYIIFKKKNIKNI